MLRKYHLLLVVVFTMGCKQAKSESFRKSNEQCRVCSNIGMARKHTFRGTRKESLKVTTSKQGLVQNSVRLATAPKMELKTDPKAFVPKGYSLFQQYKGDLNKDGKPDVVLMIKGTEKSKWVDDECRGRLDRNRRGLIILFKRKNGYEQILRNDTCFSSENEDGGIADAPELELYIIKNTLHIYFAHGRYGCWNYIFRYQNNDFELIGYNHNRCIRYVTYYNLDINFSTRTRVYEENLNVDDNEKEEHYKVTKSKIKRRKLIKLSEIADIDKLNWGDFSNE
jgi:hypothetical protein